jgi:hypothetical protein
MLRRVLPAPRGFMMLVAGDFGYFYLVSFYSRTATIICCVAVVGDRKWGDGGNVAGAWRRLFFVRNDHRDNLGLKARDGDSAIIE